MYNYLKTFHNSSEIILSNELNFSDTKCIWTDHWYAINKRTATEAYYVKETLGPQIHSQVSPCVHTTTFCII